jgi:EmrB/QacA subfamily drug resistance transporter
MTVRHDASEIEGGGASEAISAARRRGVLFAMCLSLVLVVASVSSLNLALPDLATSLGASSSAQTWIVDGYTVLLAALVLPLGALGDRVGRRNLLLVGTVIFGIAALAASFADSTGTVIASRMTMGAAAAMIMPGTLSTITAVFPADQRAKAVAIWSAFSVSGAVIGMLGAGALLETWGWESTFLATAVLAAVSFVSARTLAPNTADPAHTHLDLPGGLLSGLGIGGLVFGIIEGAENGWTNGLALAGFGVAVAGLASYVAWALHTDTPLLDVRLFKLRGFSAGSLVIVAACLASFGFFYVGLQFLQLMLGYSPLETAVALLPVVAVMVPLSSMSPRLVRRFGVRAVVVTGALVLAAGFLAGSQLTESSGYLAFLGSVAVIFAGMALSLTPATTAIVSSLPRAKQGVASAVNDATREIGTAVGIALFGSVYAQGYEGSIDSALAGQPAEATRAVSESAAAGLQVAGQLGGTAGTELTHVVRIAFMDGLTTSLTVGAAVLAATAAILFWLAPRRTEPTAPATEPTADAAEPVPAAA